MTDWEPIETAPKDGTAIYGFGLWAGEINGPGTRPKTAIISWQRGGTDYEGFEWSVAGTDAYAAWMKPSHWMPLPPPPEKSP